MVMSLWPRFFAHAVHRRLKRRLDLHPQGVADSCQAEFWQKWPQNRRIFKANRKTTRQRQTVKPPPRNSRLAANKDPCCWTETAPSHLRAWQHIIQFFLIIRSVCADLQSPTCWPGLINSCRELRFPLFMREMTSAFCRTFNRKFRKMRIFFSRKSTVSDVFRLGRKAAVIFCKPAVSMNKIRHGYRTLKCVS